ncbi:MAG: hypothetical protein QXO16_04725 [Archaeoglobaceae archaeon]
MDRRCLNLANPTIKLLKIVGSPFAPEQKQDLPKNKEEALELYNHAIKNKIGLLYLDTLQKRGKIHDLGLEAEYKKELEKHNEQLITMTRASKLLNSLSCDYAIFKSIMPFPAVPNDVDIVYFNSYEELNSIVKKFLSSGYKEVVPKGYPYRKNLKFKLHDSRICGHVDPDANDVYDLDLYYAILVSYIAYLNRVNFRKYITKTRIKGEEVKVLSPEADLVTVIAHSVIVEQLFTLLSYYATLYYLSRISIDDFILITKENHVASPIKAHFSLVAELHRLSNGFIPEKIKEVLTELGSENREKMLLAKNNFKMPHKYSSITIIKALLEKMKEKEFRRSVVKQIMYTLKDPKLAGWVVYHIVRRRRRETY